MSAAEKVASIDGTLTMGDGRQTEFQITANGYSQWGADTQILGNRVDVLQALIAALGQENLFFDENAHEQTEEGSEDG